MGKKPNAVALAFRRRLQLALDAKGWTGNRLATRAGIPQATVSRWLGGHRGQLVDPQLMWQVAALLGCDFSWLVTGNGQAPPESQSPSRKPDSAT